MKGEKERKIDLKLFSEDLNHKMNTKTQNRQKYLKYIHVAIYKELQ